MDIAYTLKKKDGPVWAFAVHDGHEVHKDLQQLLHLSSSERLREEDPYTAMLTAINVSQFIVATSRFQVDLNRPLENAIYLHPEQAWGLQVWKTHPEQKHILNIQHAYHSILSEIGLLIEETIRQYGYFIIYDIHSYNSKRSGPDEITDTQTNPQINVGTIHNDPKWRPLINTFISYIETQKIDGKKIDIRENVKFSGGNLSKWINEHYGAYGCVLSIEFRKDFMDEWTGELYPERLEELRQLLERSVAFMVPDQIN
ncbi:N-formylglutamate amidohydrolase [Sphingobacterium spiritivorum]|uniref:N-formylglutamate amidohydrolase n=1 Tax=Sphingobacterium spiritivorum TaxID=258 RepID=UPI00191B3883|nr:N-formylglutamate amidohydrolase [Sphingobacterium spiritivorum]QQT24774.1 N-formylglutamate amidohydrolase [Sphingobacterium spiritivorum]